ncbi:MAG: hypothetical protein A2V83_03245 [Nitrospirae bacterium RBG_16_64_22]|nr:MAG: hypothetical protein A2V83_03245 [Nitrospirae bacterium RBG_16_64_22]
MLSGRDVAEYPKPVGLLKTMVGAVTGEEDLIVDFFAGAVYASEVKREFAKELDLCTIEADKVRCGQKHFEALHVPFAVAVTADEV